MKLKNMTPQEHMQQSKDKFQYTYNSEMNSSLWKQLWGDATEAKERTEHEKSKSQKQRHGWCSSTRTQRGKNEKGKRQYSNAVVQG